MAPLSLRVVNVAPDKLMVRSLPSRASEARQQLPEGAIATALGTAADDGAYVWLGVRTADGVEGWVAGPYVTVVANTTPPVVPTDPLPAVRAQIRALADDATLPAAVLRERLTKIAAALGD